LSARLLDCSTARLLKRPAWFPGFPPEAGALTATTATIQRPLAAYFEKLIYFILKANFFYLIKKANLTIDMRKAK